MEVGKLVTIWQVNKPDKLGIIVKISHSQDAAVVLTSGMLEHWSIKTLMEMNYREIE